MHAAFLLMTSALLTGADPVPAAPLAPVPVVAPGGACCGGNCGSGCDTCNTCCEKESFLKKCFKKFHKNDCCEPLCCEPAPCCQPAPCCDTGCKKHKHHKKECCQPTCDTCDSCCEKESFLKKCFKKFHKKDCCDTCCDTCNSCGTTIMPAAPAIKAEPIAPPKDGGKKMPEGGANLNAPALDSGATAPVVAPKATEVPF
ncbi:MAG: hypothetical protein K2R98_10890 [Gemmataceae bacterium]|nr:hypothetical protein [Gemmataceae bacterium]